MAVATQLITVEELEKMAHTDARLELVQGEIIKMPPAGHEHGEIAGNIFAALHAFIRKHKLGKVYIAETGFILRRQPDTVRAPDAAFVTAERAEQMQSKAGFFPGPPDLAVEVISPNESAEDVEAKILDYLQAGTRLLWIIRPRTRTVTAYRSRQDIRLLTAEDTLDGADVLPGFSLPVRELF